MVKRFKHRFYTRQLLVWILMNLDIVVTVLDLMTILNFCVQAVIGIKRFFGTDMSSSVHVNNKKKDILVLGEGPTEGLHDNTLTAEVKYPINFTEPGKRFALSLHYIGSNSFLFVNAVKCTSLKKTFRSKTISIVSR